MEWFLKREMKRVKKFGVILVLNKIEERSKKRVVFVHAAVFERARNWCVKKFSPNERNFFVHVRLLKAVLCNFWCLWGLIMILYKCQACFDRNWRFQVVNLIFNANLEVFDQFCWLLDEILWFFTCFFFVLLL